MGADRLIQGRFPRLEPFSGFEPLPVIINKTDQGDRRIANLCRESDDIVKVGLILRIENVVGFECFEPKILLLMLIC